METEEKKIIDLSRFAAPHAKVLPVVSITAPKESPTPSKTLTSADLEEAWQREAPNRIVSAFRHLLSSGKGRDLDRIVRDLIHKKHELPLVMEGLQFTRRLEAALNVATAAERSGRKR